MQKIKNKPDMMKCKIIGCPKSLDFFVFFYLIFQVRTSRNTFQSGEHGMSNFSIIILNVSLNVLNICFNIFSTLPCLLSRISPVSKKFDFQALVDCQTCQSSS